MVFGSPIWEKPLASAPTMPSSLTQRCSSRAAMSGSCSGSAASAWKRSGRFVHLLGQIVVGLAGDLVGLLGVGDRLDRRRVQRQDHHLHAELVHQAKPPAVQVEDALAHLGPDVVGKERPSNRSACRRSRSALRVRSCPSWCPSGSWRQSYAGPAKNESRPGGRLLKSG